jgi:hypothetical protein
LAALLLVSCQSRREVRGQTFYEVSDGPNGEKRIDPALVEYQKARAGEKKRAEALAAGREALRVTTFAGAAFFSGGASLKGGMPR